MNTLHPDKAAPSSVPSHSALLCFGVLVIKPKALCILQDALPLNSTPTLTAIQKDTFWSTKTEHR